MEFVAEYGHVFEVLKKWEFQHLESLILWFVLIAGGVCKGYIDKESQKRIRAAFNGYERERDEECTREIEAAGEEIRQKLLARAKEGETWTE